MRGKQKEREGGGVVREDRNIWRVGFRMIEERGRNFEEQEKEKKWKER